MTRARTGSSAGAGGAGGSGAGGRRRRRAPGPAPGRRRLRMGPRAKQRQQQRGSDAQGTETHRNGTLEDGADNGRCHPARQQGHWPPQALTGRGPLAYLSPRAGVAIRTGPGLRSGSLSRSLPRPSSARGSAKAARARPAPSWSIKARMFGRIARASSGPPTTGRQGPRRPVAKINALEPEIASPVGRGAARPRPPSSSERLAKGETSTSCCRRPSPRCARPPGGARPAPLRRPAGRRHGAARGQDRRDEDRRGQDPGRHPAGLPQRAAGKGVHVVTVNDYLAKRDAEWMGRIYGFLGPDHRHHRARPERRRSAAPPTPATSPTAPTTSSASTTCATT